MTQSTLSPQLFRPYTIGAGAYLIAPEGLLCNELVVSAGAAQMDLQDPHDGHVAIFAQDDIVRIRAHGYVQDAQQGDSAIAIAHDFWAVGAIPSTQLIDVWLQVTAVTDLNTHFQYAVTRLSPTSTDQYTFARNTLVIGYGPVDNRLIRLRATRERAPLLDVFTTGNEPWVESESNIRLGRLDDLGVIDGEQYGLAAGASLTIANSPYVRVSEQGIHLSQLDLTLDDGASSTVRIESTGVFSLGTDLETENTTGLKYDPQNAMLDIWGALHAHAPISSDGGLTVNDQGTTTIMLSPAGEVKVGADVSDPEQVDLAYEPATRIVHMRNAQIPVVQIGAAEIISSLTSFGDIQLTNVDTPTVQISSNGNVQFGSDLSQPNGVVFDLQTDTGALAVAANMTLQGDLTVQGGSVSYGTLRFQTGATVKAQIDPAGGFKFGPDISDPDSIDLEYNSTTRSLQIRNAQLVDSELTSNIRIVDAVADKITMAPGYAPIADQDVARWGDVKARLAYDSREIVYTNSYLLGGGPSDGNWVRLARVTFGRLSYGAVHLRGAVLSRSHQLFVSDEIFCRLRVLPSGPNTPTARAKIFPGTEALFSELRAIHISGEDKDIVFELWGQYRVKWSMSYIEWKYFTAAHHRITVEFFDVTTDDEVASPPTAASKGYDSITDY